MKYIKTTVVILASLLTVTTQAKNIERHAEKLHQQMLTLDSHIDTPLQFSAPWFDITRDNYRGCIDIPKMERGGLDGCFFAVFVNQGDRDEATKAKKVAGAYKIFENLNNVLAQNPTKLMLCTTPEDGYKAKSEGKRAMYIGVENGYAIGDDLDNINRFRDLGARYITLVHSRNNDICDSANDKQEHGGLSEFGRRVVSRMNEQGVMVDVSHASELSAWQAIEFSKVPVIASHSCSKAVNDNVRNMSDSLIVALAKKGGVVQMCILSSYVDNSKNSRAHDTERRKILSAIPQGEEPTKTQLKELNDLRKKYSNDFATVSQAVNHIDHIVKLVGIDHVGIGTDFDGGGSLADCMTAADMKNITCELIRRGYSDKNIAKIWSGNILRVLGDVENYAKNLK